MTETTSNSDASMAEAGTEPPRDNEDQLADDGSVKRAVALHYDHKDAPKVVAKGEGIIAEQIIAAAAEHGVYIKENPLLAQALGAVELDEEIPVELYTAVAEIIGFVLSLKNAPSPQLSPQTK